MQRFCMMCGEPRKGEMTLKERMCVEFINEVCLDDGALVGSDTAVLLEMLEAPTTDVVKDVLAKRNKS